MGDWGKFGKKYSHERGGGCLQFSAAGENFEGSFGQMALTPNLKPPCPAEAAS